ncbi:MAG: hypothetical protein IPJ01_10040 [Micavibrio sp.]|nr:hypothetical protein [Micavibrio sp.]
MKTENLIPTFSIPTLIKHNDKGDFKEVFKKQLSQALGYTHKFLFEDNYFLSIGLTNNFITVDNNGYGRNRVEYLRLSFGKDFYLSTKFGADETLQYKIDRIKTRIKTILDDEKAKKDWGKKLKDLLPKGGFFTFNDAKTHEHEGEITHTLNISSESLYDLGIRVRNQQITITEKNGKREVDYDYSIEFNDAYNKKRAIKNINDFQKGIAKLERNFKALINKIEKLK